MKKLGKISINPEKVIKNEELVNLRGGYGEGNSTCSCKDASGNVILTETMWDCGCSKEDRWVQNTCAETHWSFSGCDCHPCA